MSLYTAHIETLHTAAFPHGQQRRQTFSTERQHLTFPQLAQTQTHLPFTWIKIS